MDLMRRALFSLPPGACAHMNRIVYPIDSVRRRMMMEAGRPERMYTSSFNCFRTVLATEGYKGFYRGLSANLFRGVGTSALLVLYDEIRLAFDGL